MCACLLSRKKQHAGDLGLGVITAFGSFPLLPPPDKRIVACIIGVA